MANVPTKVSILSASDKAQPKSDAGNASLENRGMYCSSIARATASDSPS